MSSYDGRSPKPVESYGPVRTGSARHIGDVIRARQERAGWGAKVIDRLSHDLRQAFPDMGGLSSRNLQYMRTFAGALSERAIAQAPLVQLTWYHHVTLLDKLEENVERLWYAERTVEHGWSRNVLAFQIASRLRERRGRAPNSFKATLPPADSDFAAQVFKDPTCSTSSARPIRAASKRSRTRSSPTPCNWRH